MINRSLIDKYNKPGPRYTSYPTVPYWRNESMEKSDWMNTLNKNYQHFGSKDISLYIHLPFCESLCTFCGCHKRITKNHAVENPYLDALKKEWNFYQAKLSFEPKIKELHFGGGTPTFFSANKLIDLLQTLFQQEKVNPHEHDLSFEAHPNNTTFDHLTELYTFGFRRLSLGIQDYSPVVQKAIHRFQSYEQVQKVHNQARDLGYTSISHDLVFGLPKQTIEDIIDTVNKTLLLMPDRISLYSYAHVPWIKGNGQRGFDEKDLPDGETKRELYETAKKMLEAYDYIEIGMDHFAKKSDEMAVAFQEKKLHRNFMGYTTKNTSLLIGLGASAISDSWYGFAQNEKSIERYQEMINQGDLAIYRGHLLDEKDLCVRTYIHDLMCHFQTKLSTVAEFQEMHHDILYELEEMVKDGLVAIEGNTVTVTTKGIPFVRNVCMAFDQNLKQDQLTEGIFSKTI
jgi:oxygen-independent coproporphyrinogen III oxidase